MDHDITVYKVKQYEKRSKNKSSSTRRLDEFITFRDLEEFILSYSNDFVPPLASRGNLIDTLKAIANHGGSYYTEINGNIIAAVTYIKNNKRHSAYIPYIVTDKDYRGQNYMKNLITLTMKYFAAKRYNKLWLETWSTNKVALNLFKKLGFKIVERTKNGRLDGVDNIKLEALLKTK
ncbi:GNAT family N-acetyltransferase [Candidatus Woesearchaeota archaeon]|nr:GNAT family N-acetyltransferase [Candidatus Woesearchaeota archaeon]